MHTERSSVMDYLRIGGVEGKCFWQGYSEPLLQRPSGSRPYEIIHLDQNFVGSLKEKWTLAAFIKYLDRPKAKGVMIYLTKILGDLEVHPTELIRLKLKR